MTLRNTRVTHRMRIAERRQRVTDMYLQGMPQWQIARDIKVSTGTVCLDLKFMKELWVANGLVSTQEKVEKELAKIDQIETRAWEAYLNSTLPKEERYKRVEKAPKTEIVTDDDGKMKKETNGELIQTKVISNMKRKGQSGDPRFLEQIRWCVETRLKLLGLLKGETIVNNNMVSLNFADLMGPPEDADPIQAKIDAVKKPVPEITNISNGAKVKRKKHERGS